MRWEVKDTGRKFAGSDLLSPLCIGVTYAVFKMLGIFPESIVALIILLNIFANTPVALLIMTAGMPSGPGAAPVASISMHSLTKG